MQSIFRLTGAFIMAAGLASGAQAQSVTVTPEGERVELPECTDSAGVAVRFQIKANNNPQAPNNGWLAFSSFSPMTGPIIQLNESVLELPVKAINFVAEHECAHHELGHIRDMLADYIQYGRVDRSTEQLHQMEHEADCAAVPAVQEKYGYTETDLREIFDVFPPNEDSNYHPPTSERLTHALQCMNP